MLQKRHNSVITFFILLALVGVTKPAKVLAQFNAAEGQVPQANINLDDSGMANPGVEDSGEVNFDVEGSGEVNFDVEGSGEVNYEFENSGTVDPNAEGSGEINLDLEDSGKFISSVNLETDKIEEVNARSAIRQGTYLEAAESVAQLADPDDDSTITEDTEDDNGGLWWTLLLLLPLIALALYLFSRGKKGDREPAIGNVPNPDNPQGGSSLPTATNSDLYPKGSNLSGGLGNVPTNIGTASSLGGTALAEGAATSNLVGERNIDGDRLGLETESDPVVEIPSNPVSEFTAREISLQTNEQPTKLQGEVNGELDDNTLGLIDRATPVGEEDFVEEATETSIPDRSTMYVQSDDLEHPTERATTDVENPDLTETNARSKVAREFRGDYVLEEETTDESIPEVNTAVDVSDLNEDKIDAEFNKFPEDVSPGSIANDLATPEVELSDDENITIDDSDLSERVMQADEAATGSIAAASAFTLSREDFDRSTDLQELDNNVLVDRSNDSPTETEAIAVVESASDDLDTGLEKITSDETNDSVERSVEEITFDDVTDSALNSEEIAFDDATDSVLNSEEIAFDDATDSAELSVKEITFDDATDSAEFNLDDVSDDSIDAVPNEITLDDYSDSTELNLDEFTLDDLNDNTANASLDEFTLDDDRDSTELDLDEFTLDDYSDSTELNLDEFTLDDLNDNTTNASLDEFTIDDDRDSTELDLDEITFDNANDNSIDELIDSIDTTSSDRDISLDDLDFEKSLDNSTSNLLSDNTAEITDLSDDETNDMDNISQWLNSLETSDQNTDNISEWLDKLNVQDVDSVREDSNQENRVKSEDRSDDFSLQFLDDLAEEDSKINRDNQ